jgi:S1-C subfamily serine protease
VRVETRVTQALRGAPRGMGMEGGEQRREALGVVIDPSGLTVVPVSLIDPKPEMEATQQPVGMTDAEGKPFRVDWDVEILGATIILEDGAQAPADVVLEDEEMDLAFLKPREAGRTFSAIELKPRGSLPQLAERVFVLGRLSRLANRTVAFAEGYIRGVVGGAHPFAVCSQDISIYPGYIGCVVYAANGAPLGLLVNKISKERDVDALMELFTGENKEELVLTVLRTVEDVLASAARAKEATKPVKPPKPRPPTARVPEPIMRPPVQVPVAPPPPPPPPPDKSAKKEGEF